MRFYRIYIGDSRELLKKVADNSVSLMVTSPPYWLVAKYSTEETDVHKADLSLIEDRRTFFSELEKVWKECFRIVKPGGYAVVNWQDLIVGSKIFGYPREICITGDMVESVENCGFYIVARRIWKKYEYGGALTKAKYSLYEHLSGSDPRALGNWEYLFTFKKPSVVKETRIVDVSREEWMEWSDGVWKIQTEAIPPPFEDITYGAYFPVELPYRCIKIYTSPGKTVLDPFLGTGSTMAAAFKTKRNCIGVELHKKMVPIIKEKCGFGQVRLDEENIKWELIE